MVKVTLLRGLFVVTPAAIDRPLWIQGRSDFSECIDDAVGIQVVPEGEGPHEYIVDGGITRVMINNGNITIAAMVQW